MLARAEELRATTSDTVRCALRSAPIVGLETLAIDALRLLRVAELAVLAFDRAQFGDLRYHVRRQIRRPTGIISPRSDRTPNDVVRRSW